MFDEKADIIQTFRFDRAKTTLGSYGSIARLKPGVSIRQVNADVGRMINMEFQKCVVLLIAYANVGNLLLVRAEDRE